MEEDPGEEEALHVEGLRVTCHLWRGIISTIAGGL